MYILSSKILISNILFPFYESWDLSPKGLEILPKGCKTGTQAASLIVIILRGINGSKIVILYT